MFSRDYGLNLNSKKVSFVRVLILGKSMLYDDGVLAHQGGIGVKASNLRQNRAALDNKERDACPDDT